MKFKKILSFFITAAIAGCSFSGCSGSDAVEGADVDYEWGNVSIGGGGYVTGMIYNYSEEGLVYARTDIGGAYRYDNDAQKWVAITDFLGSDDWNLIGIESLATDNVEPNRVYFAGGTYSSSNGAIFSSDDYGNTWERYDLPFGCGGNEAGRGTGERLMVDPNDNSIIYFGSRSNGLWKSEDYGKSWNEVTSFPSKGNYVQDSMSIGIMWIEFDKSSGSDGKPTQTIYAGVADTDGNTICKSSDGGETWEKINTGMAGMYPLQADISDNGNMYVCFSNNAGPNASPNKGCVMKYNLADGSFTDITPEGAGDTFGFGGISVDTQNPDTVVVSSLGLWSPMDTIFRTTDGGESWLSLYDDGYTMDTSNSDWLKWGSDEAKLGWWIADVNINPFNSDEIMYGTGATIYATENMTALGSGTDVVVQSHAVGIEETAVFEVISPPEDVQLYSIMGDLAGFTHFDVDVAPTDEYFYKQTATNDIDCAFLNPSFVVYTSDLRSSLRISSDYGKTFKPPHNLPEGCEDVVNGTVAVSADGSSFIWSPGSIKVKSFVTDDLGETWTECNGLSYNATVIADRINPQKYYAICDGIFYYSTDGGKNFEKSNALISEKAIAYASPYTEDDVWLCSGVLMHSTDGGKTFTSVKGINAECIGFGAPENDGEYMVIYAIGSTDDRGDGIYRSKDMGVTWEKLNDNNHLFGNITPSITGDYNIYGRVYFATNGRGIVMGDEK